MKWKSAVVVLAVGIAAGRARSNAVGSPVQARPGVVRSQLAWFDRSGRRSAILGDLADYGNLELSPDGKRVAVAILDQTIGTRDLWFVDAATGARTRFTSDPADENWLIWSPDGRRVAFNSFRPGRLLIYQSPSSGIGKPEVLLADDDEGKWPVSWSPDGRFILCTRNTRETGNDLWILPLGGDRKPYPFLQTRSAENWGAFSPDGRWIAYSSDESGRVEQYVAPFPAQAGRKWLVSKNGGFQARWRRDGKELFFLAGDRTLMAAAVNGAGADFEVSGVQSLFETRLPYPPYHAYDVTADGQRFLVNTAVLAPGAPTKVARLFDLQQSRSDPY
jgi:Tol biopolymer transport system component